jgi:SAM-dependent methyltransferase
VPADSGAELDYGGFFRQPGAVADYLQTYAPGSASSDSLAWPYQRRYLHSVVRAFVADRPAGSALDYACGDGRILEQLAPYVARVHGWDSSPAMLQRCARRLPGAQLRHLDLADPDSAEPARAAGAAADRFDLITVFRLFLNLEPDRRRRVARRLAGLLAPGGLLIFDNHGNRHSLRHLPVSLGARRHRFANEWSDAQVRELVDECGLTIVDRAGFGWLPEVLHRNRWSATPARRVESFLLGRSTSPWLAIRVVYVAQRPQEG